MSKRVSGWERDTAGVDTHELDNEGLEMTEWTMMDRLSPFTAEQR